MCVPMTVLKHVKQILESSMRKFRVVMGDLNSPLPVIGKSRKQVMRNQVYNPKIIGSHLSLLNSYIITIIPYYIGLKYLKATRNNCKES